jgi:hypothetical protein
MSTCAEAYGYPGRGHDGRMDVRPYRAVAFDPLDLIFPTAGSLATV